MITKNVYRHWKLTPGKKNLPTVKNHYHDDSDFPGGSESKAAYSVGDLGSVPGLGRSPGEGNDNSLQYSCLENPMDGGAW